MGHVTEAIVLKDQKTNTRFMFPVNPDQISISDGRMFQEIPIINLGTTLLAGPMTPQGLQFESFFPKIYDASYCNYLLIENPINSWNRIVRWMGRNVNNVQLPATPLRVTVTGSKFSQIMVVTDFSRDQFGGEPGDIFYRITLKQWRRQVIRIEAEDDTSKETKRTDVPKSGTTYTVKKGDTLWAIAKRFYGDGSKWPTIYNANKAVIGGNPNLIRPGQVLVIP